MTDSKLIKANQNSGHGGKRAGAGRKAGSVTKKTREIAEKAAESGLTPLEVMLGTMRELWANAEKGQVIAPGEEGSQGHTITTPLDYRLMAVEVAQKAAPFVHAKLASVEVGGNPDGVPIQVVTRRIVRPQ